MLRSLTRWSLVALVPLTLAAACGSDDGKKHSSRDDAGGEAGAAGAKPTSGGSMMNAGQPALPDAGAGGTPETVTGGAGGAAPVIPSGGAGGEVPASVGGAGGEGGEQGVCCQPLVCDTAELGCNAYINDGCGHTSNCGCAPGEVCNDSNKCQVCEPDPDYCANNSFACGDTTDDCGNPISCTDNCGEAQPGSSCLDGQCCLPNTECFGACGTISDGCGGTLDCGNSCDGGTCKNNVCCNENSEACLGFECGQTFNGCTSITCGTCEGTQGCVDHSCVESACKPLGYECGSVANPNSDGGFEDCGVCALNETCIDNLCIPICR